MFAPVLAPLSFAVASALAFAAPSVDLAKRYPATLDYFEGQPTREWTATAEDVWSLKAFHYDRGGKLALDFGPSTVVFGTFEKNVLWAALFPEKPAEIKTSLPGDGEHGTCVWMRFHPSRVGELFPAKTVLKNGPDSQLVWARRLCNAKINGGWQANNLPVIPKQSSIVLDVETAEGKRRYFTVDTDTGVVEQVAFFLDRTLPKLEPIDRKDAVAAFDQTWQAFDREYAKFVIRPKVDWDKLGAKYRKEATTAATSFEAAAAIASLLAHLEDLHIWVKAGDEWVPGYNRQRPLNGSWRAVQALIPQLNDAKHGLTWGRTNDGIAYWGVHELEDAELPRAFDDAMEKLGDTWGAVIDLRFNGGGDETLARDIAGRFVDQRRVYSLNQYREGSKHDSLGPKLERVFEPRGPWRYGAPVIALWGQRTMSSAESFALMLAQCPQVTTMGDRTAGSSANPRRLDLPGKISVNMPRWIDYDPQGKSIEDVGIAPSIQIDAKPEEFTNTRDPVLEAALERLRKTPEAERKSARTQ